MKEITHINFAKCFRGGERQTLLLIQELASRGYIQHIYIKATNELFFTKLVKINNLTIHKVKKPYFRALKTLKTTNVIIAHEAKAYQLAFFNSRLNHTPYILVRRVDFDIKKNFINRLIYTHATKIVSLSSSISSKITKLAPNVTPIIIPDSYTKFDINKKKIHELKIRFKDKYIIGNIAALDPKKGQREIIEVAKHYQQIAPDIHFIFLGEGEDREYLLQKSHGLTNVTFEGFVDNVGDYLDIFDLFLFPSHAEGFGSILLDVIKAQVPIIASNVGGIPEIITHNQNGLLLETITPEAIIKSIDILKNNKALQKTFCENGYNILESYSIENITSKYEDIILKII